MNGRGYVGDGDRCEPGPHGSPLRARRAAGPQSGEKRGLSRIDAASRRRASARWPAPRAAAPAWNRNSGSREPSRRARCAKASPSSGCPARVSAQPRASAERTLGAAAQARRPSTLVVVGSPDRWPDPLTATWLLRGRGSGTRQHKLSLRKRRPRRATTRCSRTRRTTSHRVSRSKGWAISPLDRDKVSVAEAAGRDRTRAMFVAASASWRPQHVDLGC